MSVGIPIEALPFLRPSHKHALQAKGGFATVVEVLQACADPETLRVKTGLGLDDAAWVLDALCNLSRKPVLMTLADVLEKETKRDALRLATFSKDLDALLGGGVALGSLTEICGAPGVGKTQLAMQLCVSCFLPQMFGGFFGTTAGSSSQSTATQTTEGPAPSPMVGCVYVDTEGSFVASRYREIASAAVAQVTRIVNQPRWQTTLSPSELDTMRREASHFTVERILAGTQYVRITSLEDLLTFVYGLPSLLTERPQWKLIVIDSIAFPLRGAAHLPSSSATVSSSSSSSSSQSCLLDALQLSRLVFHVGQHLQRASQLHHTCIVTTNQMTTKFHVVNQQRVCELVPALGDTWAHCVSTRVVLRAPRVPTVSFSETVGASQLRVAELRKSPTEVRGECTFVVCSSGIRNSAGVVAVDTEHEASRGPPRSHSGELQPETVILPVGHVVPEPAENDMGYDF